MPVLEEKGKDEEEVVVEDGLSEKEMGYRRFCKLFGSGLLGDRGRLSSLQSAFIMGYCT